MNKIRYRLLIVLTLWSGLAWAQLDRELPRVKTAAGELEGVDLSGVRVFKGIPFAAPPVGNLRWKAPQPVAHWEGIRKADRFGNRPMQLPLFSDMLFQSEKPSEDCLYLNVWTPAVTGKERLPVLVYFYGGGLMAGGGCEFRYGGEALARQGIITITANYRLGIFGFFAHPDLTRESHTSGNWGYLDQAAALQWVHDNIAAFGGDPNRVTIAGESAGSISVSALMCSPLSKKLMAGAIGSSGSLLGALSPMPLAQAEQNGIQTAQELNATTLEALRQLPAEQLVKAKGRFSSTIDGYFLPKAPIEIYAAGEQAHIPCLIGWNSMEMNPGFLFKGQTPTLAHLRDAMKGVFGDQADQAMELYQATDEQSVNAAATEAASDAFIAFSTWKWTNIQQQTGGQPVYRYRFCRPRPITVAARSQQGSGNPASAPAAGAVHSADIEYALGNLSSNRVYDWQIDDYRVSEIFQLFYLNFVKTGNPNGLGLPAWPSINHLTIAPVMQIDVNTRVTSNPQLEKRYQFLDHFYFSKQH